MSPIQWKSEYSVNVKEIDEQHKIFVDILNELSAAVNSSNHQKLKDDLDNIFKRLTHYAAYHFATEEKYFDQLDYPQAPEHKEAHLEFYAQIMELLERYHESKLEITEEVLTFMENWLTHHILEQDKHYTQFFNSKGIY